VRPVIESAFTQDALALWEAAGRPLTLDAVCPQRFAAPIAPHLAAIAEGKTLDVELASTALSAWADHCDIVVVEGAGGLMSPIDEEEYIADLAFDFGYPMVVVAKNVVGAINQTLQTLIAASHFRDGLAVGAVVLNDVQESDDPASDSNLEEVVTRVEGPLFSRLRYEATSLDDPIDWYELASQ
jgi:dethiobiotin synthetase